MGMFQPRLGAAWDITGDARNVVRLSWGRFMHAANTSLPSFLTTQSTGTAVWLSCTGIVGMAIGDPVSTPDECAAWAADRDYGWMADNEGWDPLGWYLNPVNVFAGAEPNGVDPGLDPAYADELILSYERGIWKRSALEFSYIDKTTQNLFEDTCNGNIPNPSADAACDYFVVANLEPLKRDYQGFVVRMESRDLDWLTVLASYVYSESKGSADERHYFWEAWDIYPWHWENRYGYLQDHRDHRVKLNGYFLLPYDFTIGFDSFWSSEFTYTPQADTADNSDIPYGTYFVEPRGSGKAYPNYQFDLQVAKGFNLGAGTRIEVILAVFNLLSNEQPIEVCESISGCLGDVELGEPTDWQVPRRYELGFRFEF